MLIRELAVRLGLSVDEASFAKGQLAASLITAALTKIVQVAADTAHAFVDNIHAVTEYGGKIYELAQVTGLGTDSLQKLAKAAGAEGIGIEDFGHSIVLLSRQINSAKDGNEEAGKAFAKAGAHLRDEGGKLKPTQEIFLDIAEKFHGMEDGAEKTALALKLFGRSGAAMIPLLNQGKEEIEEFMKAQVMDPEQIKAAHEIEVIQRRLLGVTKALWREAIGPLLPALRDLYQRYLDWRKANAEIMKQRIREFVGFLIKAVGVLGDVFTVATGAIRAFSAHGKAAEIGIIALVAAIAIFKGAAIVAGIQTAIAWAPIALVFAGIAAAVAAVLLLMEDFAVYKEGGDSVIGDFLEGWDEWVNNTSNDSPPIRMMKQLLQMLGSAKEIIDGIEWFFRGNEKTAKRSGYNVEGGQTMAAVEARRTAGPSGVPFVSAMNARPRAPGDIRTEGSIDSTSYTAGRPGDDRNFLSRWIGGPVVEPTAPIEARINPEDTGSSRWKSAPSNVNVTSPITMNVTQAPGEDSEDFADRVMKIAGGLLQGHIEDAVAAGR